MVVLAERLKNRLYLFTKAFDLGIIEYQRVLEVTVLPFIKLARKCQHPRAGSPHLRDSAPEALLSIWADALGTSLSWHSKGLPKDSGFMKPALQASKRAEMVKAMIGARIHEVRPILSAWLQHVVVSGGSLVGVTCGQVQEEIDHMHSFPECQNRVVVCLLSCAKV